MIVFEEYLADPTIGKGVISIALIIIVALIKSVLGRSIIKRSKKKKTGYRSKVNTMRNTLNISLVFILIVLWAGEIQAFTFSIAAFMVAIVFATKEYLQCYLGYFYYVSARPFRIGDWIQINEGVGEVIAADWTKITMLEVDQHTNSYTGKHLFIPNHQILLKPVRNLNFLRRYTLSSFTITCEPTIDVFPVVEELRNHALDFCKDFIDVAERYKGVIEKRLDVEFIPIEPHFSVDTNQFAKICIGVDIFCPIEESIPLRQKITQQFFKLWHEKVGETPSIERRRTANIESD
ncbi:mechanosensitive ion channel family protein [Glaciecola siphonariae]|uniref:Mechanosensitive ion channel family protein n=1 Tax=Glaciecola siphonariae TaxID=521012 RepID=A0ABV9LT98_9ALTE